MPRPDEAALFGAPECEAQVTAPLSRLLRQLQGRFEHGSRAAAIVVDAGALGHAVEMRSHHNPGAVAARGFGHDVAGGSLSRDGVDGETHGDAAGLSLDAKGAAERIRDANRWNRGELRQLARKRIFPTVSAFVHDDDTDGAGGDGVLDLDPELAGPTSDQRHGAAFEILKVAGLTSAR